MPRTATLVMAVLAVLCLSAAASPAGIMPEPLEGWTASGPVYGESLIGKAAPAPRAGEAAAKGKRIEISRDYRSDGRGLRISLNTHDLRGAQIISHVNQARDHDSAEAARLAVKGIVPFSHGSLSGVAMKAVLAGKGQVTGVALRLGVHGTLTLEGMHEGKPATVPLDDVKAYLKRTDLKGMAAFVRKANETPQVQPEEGDAPER